MRPEEYGRLSDVEKEHWFYKGKRLIVLEWLKRLGALSRDSLLVDVGAGTGIFVDQLSTFCRTLGVEYSSSGLSLAVQKGHAGRVIGGSAGSLPLKSNSVDIVTCLDMLEHVQDDRQAFCEILRVVKPGGLILITVPAFSWAMSSWDISLGHYRRYHAGDILKLASGSPVEIVHMNYVNSLLFFPVVIYRKFFSKKGDGLRLEDQIPLPWLNHALLNCFVWPAVKGIPMPFGLSLFAILRKQ